MRMRVPIALLAASLTLGGGLALKEGFTPTAIRPVPGDRPTYGHGSTVRADGQPVQMGDKITPTAALQLMVRDVSAKESVLRKCIDAPLHQYEFDAFVSLAYNVGAESLCRSSIPRKLAAGDYAGACRTILDFKRVQGRDCSLAQNKGFCGGVWARRQDEYRQCVGEIAP
ncbi:glycoside hydrolase family protein [Azonexus fungiphilus]|uniref:glycoside hydrolase family protein n=1 Tax=Azonexus fungiphilus TaxID=146940 RepID=UPI001C2C5139|nr:glycoside hydrolase family protein [Azonexus fungiphilus]